MSFYYPQACIKLRVLPEDFKLTSDASLQKPYEIVVVAKSLTVNIADYKTSSSFNCEIDYKNFPFDPRALRYVGVVVHIQDMKSLVNKDGTANTIKPLDSNAVFAGFVDEETVTFDDTHRTVRFEGRDFTSLLIDQKYAENIPIDLNLPLDQAIQIFLAKFKATQEIKIVNQTGTYDTQKQMWDNPPLPIVASYDPASMDALGAKKNPGSKESYWEIIQDIVHRAGLICYMHLSGLIITKPRNLYNNARDLKMIYGQNVKNLTYKRKLGRLKNFNLLVRSRAGKEVVFAKIPEEATEEWCKSYGIKKEAATAPVLKPDGSLDETKSTPAPYISFPIPNIGSKEQLIQIGQSVYEEYSRQQLEGSLETREMVGHAGINAQDKNWHVYDLTQLKIGQPIGLEIAVDDIVSISRLSSVGERAQYLLKRGYSRDIAGAFASSMGKLSPRFFTKSYSMSLDADTGFKLKIEFINIIETKYNAL